MMKWVVLLDGYLKGMRLHVIAIVSLMTLSMFIWIVTIGTLRYVFYDYKIVKTAEDDLYYTEAFLTDNDVLYLANGEATEVSKRIEALIDLPAIDHVYCVYTVNSVSYLDKAFSITLIDPKLLSDFPALKDLGIDFGDSEDGCILVGTYYDNVHGEIELGFNYPQPHMESFHVIHQIRSDYKRLSLNNASTNPLAEDLFTETYSDIIMLATPSNLDRFSRMAIVGKSTNYIIGMKHDATLEEKQEIIDSTKTIANMVSIKTIAENTKNEIFTAIKRQVPRPAFLLLATTVSFLSMAILFVKRKKVENAVSRLCGASRKRIAIIAMSAMAVVSILPALINSLIVLLIDRSRFSEILFPGKLYEINLSGLLLGTPAYLMIIVFFVLTAWISFMVVLYSGQNMSPAEYLDSCN